MIIGIPKEIKDQEYRVAAVPGAVAELIKAGHEVLIETKAGIGSGIEDKDYEEVGAKIIDFAKDVWEKADIIYKVKEPLEEEYKYLREDLILYTYLHLAGNENLAKELVDKKVTGIAYETLKLDNKLPLLTPMSEIAGRMAVQEGARYLTKPAGGRGILLQGVPGVRPAHVVIVGAGTVGTGAVRIAVGMGARVTVLDVNIEALSRLQELFPDKIETLYSNSINIEESVKSADLVISTVLIPGRRAPQLIKEDMVKQMKEGSVIVDVAIDQGGSTDITKGHPTSHTDPIFVKHGVIHYAVANIPGAVAMTSTYALSNATTRYIKTIANLGLKSACEKSPEIISAINTYDGYITNKGVAEDDNFEYKELNIK
ncbi:alanine dehydrogenase [Anaerococcus hydrogenalis]|uniref:alanine dehydrogenase n=1 Tax=Anaerococcus hydrogenalis TaxID=33029 RepID=UPI002902D64A|nr:alanine dehydrogenase [Anaerococcus hydrogenalis]MDU1316643.1 alanine dehydrogenase [Anaerococcus hydrogenalis]